MTQRPNQTVRNSFIRGLLTESSPLNFPEEASVDELNCTLFRSGERGKRLAVQVEEGSTGLSGNFDPGRLYHTTTWENVGNIPALEYVVVQTGARVRFFKKGTVPLIEGIVPVSDSDPSPYVLNLSDYNSPAGLGASTSKIEVSSINGELVIVSPQINPIRVQRNEDGSFSVEEISFRIRDFEWQGDRIFYDDPQDTPSLRRQYDTKNTGWTGGPNDIGDSARESYISSTGNWPPLTHPWYSGKDSNGNFSVAEWQKVYSGRTIIGNGHYILNLFNKDRSAVSGVAGLPTEIEEGRFNCTTAYAGRVWYSGIDSRVYYSQILENNNQLGECLQSNDPTSEEISDILATDGGYINIPEAQGIKKLHVFGSSLLVMADNGVWRISGIDGNLFKADDFSVYKVTSYGLAFRTSFVAGQNEVPFWWSYSGIHTIQVTENGGFTEVNLSRDTIQTFFEDIGGEQRAFATGEYDAFDDKIAWLYPAQGEGLEYKLNKVLFLDISIGAFYPWEISDTETNSPYIVGTSFFNGRGAGEVDFQVIDSNGDFVVDSNGDQVIVTREVGTVSSSNIYFLCVDPSDNTLNFCLFNSRNYLDWGSADYEAYAEAAYNYNGDLGRRKSAIYITVYTKRTEQGFTLVDSAYQAIDPSSIKVSSFWDFKTIPSTAAQEAYRLKGPVVVDTSDLSNFDYPYEVLASRLKLRGRGRVMKLRFEGTTGKGFRLLGWENLSGVNPTY